MEFCPVLDSCTVHGGRGGSRGVHEAPREHNGIKYIIWEIEKKKFEKFKRI